MRQTIAWLTVLGLLASAPPARGQSGAIENFPEWLKGKLAAVADTKLPEDKRVAAREQIVAQCGPNAAASTDERRRRIAALADQLGPLLKSDDLVTVVNAANILGHADNLSIVKLLAESVGNPQPVVRYWAARGLAQMQDSMARLGDKTFFADPLAALAAQAAKEEKVEVLREIYRALALTSEATRDDQGQRSTIRKQFLIAFEARVKRLGRGKLDGCLAEATGLETSGHWADLSRNDKLALGAIAFAQSQLLQWATQLYSRAAELNISEDRKMDLAILIAKAAEVLGKEAGQPGFAGDVRRFLTAQPPDVINLQIKVNDFVGAEGQTDWVTKSALGVTEMPKPLDLEPPAPGTD